MVKNLLVVAALFVSVNASALEEWCIWDNEEYIKDSMEKNNLHWLEAVYGLHTSSESTDVAAPVPTPTQPDPLAFEGVGSCRFIDRSLAEKPADVITKYVASYSFIIPTRAYLKMGASNEIVIPKAFYSAGTNWIYVEKDFYSVDRPVCEKQKAQMIQLGKDSSGIRFNDVEIKKNKFGGVSVVINGADAGTNYLGLCHFH